MVVTMTTARLYHKAGRQVYVLRGPEKSAPSASPVYYVAWAKTEGEHPADVAGYSWYELGENLWFDEAPHRRVT